MRRKPKKVNPGFSGRRHSPATKAAISVKAKQRQKLIDELLKRHEAERTNA